MQNRPVPTDEVPSMRLLSRWPRAGAALLPALLVALSLSACVNLAPDYQRPAAPVSGGWPSAAGAAPAGTAADAADIAWRDFIVDERLRRVVELAIANSRDMRVALLGVEQARARYRVQDASRWPSVDAGAGFTRTHGGGATTSATSLSVGLGSYELDLFGRVRNANDKALQAYL